MTILGKFFSWLLGLFIHETAEQVKEELQKPKTIEDANTPKNLKADVDADVQRQLNRLRGS